MAYINLRPDLYGITSLLDFRPETAEPLCRLTQILLRGESTLTEAERELIASFVSSRNACTFCMTSHGAIAAHLPGGHQELVEAIWKDYQNAPIGDKLKSLLQIADKVAQGGLHVTPSDIAAAKDKGASDLDIHDTVLIAATFCMFNRYVDGLGATTPDDAGFYQTIGKQRAAEGYLTKSVLVKD